MAQDGNGDGDSAQHGGASGTHAAGRRRGRWVYAAVGAGLILVSGLGFALARGGSSPEPSGKGEVAAATTEAAATSAAPTASSTALTALPLAGGFGFTQYSKVPAPASKVVGAVQLAYFDGFLYAAATGADGNVRIVSVPAGTSTASASWTIVPGVSTAVQPALVGAGDGLELYTTATGGKVERAVLSTPGGGWSSWTQLGTAGIAGAPAAAVQGGNQTIVVAASTSHHLEVGGVVGGHPSATWQTLGVAPLIEPQVAVAVHGSDTAIYVVRASDGATVRIYDGQYPWPTGAAGQPATAYAADGRPDLFVLSASAGVQVFEFSGADLRGTMNWVSAGVSTINPPGVTSVPGGGVALAAVNPDGSVSVYTTTR